MKIFKLRHVYKHAPPIFAAPNHDAFCRDILRNLRQLPPDASLPNFQLGDPDAKTEGFFTLGNSVMVFDQKTWGGPMGPVLKQAGNVHETKLNDTGETLYFLNVTAGCDCVDRENTIYNTPCNQGEKGVDHQMGMKHMVLDPALVGASSIFKIPELWNATIFVKSEGKEEADDFYHLCQEAGLQSFRFDEV